MNEFLKEMIKNPSVSGVETKVGEVVANFAKPWADSVEKDVVGNVYANVYGEHPVLLSGHMDEIGLMISYIGDKGEIYVTKIGGIYVPMYFGHKVRIHTKNGVVYGCVCVNRESYKDPQVTDLVVDIGANSKEEAKAVVEVGDTITFDTDFRPLLNNKFTARAFDDRCGAYVVFEALRRAKEQGLKTACTAVASVGEEIGAHGAFFAAEKVKPEMAIVVDVTYTSDYKCGFEKNLYGDIKVGGGPVLCVGPTCSRELLEQMKKVAKDNNIDVQFEVTGGATHTDGDKIHLAASGVPITLVSIPLRYMHSASEVLSIDDLENSIELIKCFLLAK